jgi:hypothetical protein
MRLSMIFPAFYSLLLVGCGESPPVIVEDIPANVQRNVELLSLPAPLKSIFNSYGGLEVTRNAEPGRVSWAIAQDGAELGTYVVSFAADGESKTSISKSYVKGQPAKPASDHIAAETFASEGISDVIGNAVDRAAVGETLKDHEARQLLDRYGRGHMDEMNALQQRVMKNIGQNFR